MDSSLELVIKYLINQNNHNINISFPAVVVGVEKLVDGLVDVQPVVSHLDPLTRKATTLPVLYDISLLFPNTSKTTISFPVNQGDYVDLIVQSVDIQRFVDGDEGVHDPDFLSHGNLSNVVALVGFTPFQKSPFNPNNYRNEFNNQDLNIVHNKNTESESSIRITPEGVISLKSSNSVDIETERIELTTPKIDAGDAILETSGDVIIGGRSLKEFMSIYDAHTHTGNQGAPTSPPIK